MGELALRLAVSDPAGAERALKAIRSKDVLELATSDVAPAMAPHDLDRAVRLTRSISGRGWDQIVLVKIAHEVDPYRAESIARLVTDKARRESALRSAAERMAALDPERAERIARSIDDP